MFGLLRFAWRCAIKIMACGSIIRTLPVEKRALAGMGVLLQQGERPTSFAADSGFAAEGTRREPAKVLVGEGVLPAPPAAAKTNR
jgi:hypothetical protein